MLYCLFSSLNRKKKSSRKRSRLSFVGHNARRSRGHTRLCDRSLKQVTECVCNDNNNYHRNWQPAKDINDFCAIYKEEARPRKRLNPVIILLYAYSRGRRVRHVNVPSIKCIVVVAINSIETKNKNRPRLLYLYKIVNCRHGTIIARRAKTIDSRIVYYVRAIAITPIKILIIIFVTAGETTLLIEVHLNFKFVSRNIFHILIT